MTQKTTDFRLPKYASPYKYHIELKPNLEQKTFEGNVQIEINILEKTNESYSLAKIAGIKMIEAFNKQYKTDYICLMPCNLFGPNDNYDLKSSHFLPALIKKIFIASQSKGKKVVNLWGTGKPLREVLHVDEVAKACEFSTLSRYRIQSRSYGGQWFA